MSSYGFATRVTAGIDCKPNSEALSTEANADALRGDAAPRGDTQRDRKRRVGRKAAKKDKQQRKKLEKAARRKKNEQVGEVELVDWCSGRVMFVAMMSIITALLNNFRGKAFRPPDFIRQVPTAGDGWSLSINTGHCADSMENSVRGRADGGVRRFLDRPQNFVTHRFFMGNTRVRMDKYLPTEDYSGFIGVYESYDKFQANTDLMRDTATWLGATDGETEELLTHHSLAAAAFHHLSGVCVSYEDESDKRAYLMFVLGYVRVGFQELRQGFWREAQGTRLYMRAFKRRTRQLARSTHFTQFTESLRPDERKQLWYDTIGAQARAEVANKFELAERALHRRGRQKLRAIKRDEKRRTFEAQADVERIGPPTNNTIAMCVHFVLIFLISYFLSAELMTVGIVYMFFGYYIGLDQWDNNYVCLMQLWYAALLFFIGWHSPPAAEAGGVTYRQDCWWSLPGQPVVTHSIWAELYMTLLIFLAFFKGKYMAKIPHMEVIYFETNVRNLCIQYVIYFILARVIDYLNMPLDSCVCCAIIDIYWVTFWNTDLWRRHVRSIAKARYRTKVLGMATILPISVFLMVVVSVNLITPLAIYIFANQVRKYCKTTYENPINGFAEEERAKVQAGAPDSGRGSPVSYEPQADDELTEQGGSISVGLRREPGNWLPRPTMSLDFSWFSDRLERTLGWRPDTAEMMAMFSAFWMFVGYARKDPLMVISHASTLTAYFSQMVGVIALVGGIAGLGGAAAVVHLHSLKSRDAGPRRRFTVVEEQSSFENVSSFMETMGLGGTMNSQMKALALAGSSIRGVTTILGGAGAVISYIGLNLFNVDPLCPRNTRVLLALAELMRRFEKFVQKEAIVSITPATYPMAKELVRMNDVFLEDYECVARIGGSPVGIRWSAAQTEFRALRDNIRAYEQDPDERVQTIWISIIGATGVGKSSFAAPFSRLVGAAFGSKRNSNLHTMDVSDEWQDGYRGEFVVAYDDPGQLTDPATMYKHYATLFSTISAAPSPLHVADMHRKGTELFNPAFLITTNNRDVYAAATPLVTDPTALARRQAFRVTVTAGPNLGEASACYSNIYTVQKMACDGVVSTGWKHACEASGTPESASTATLTFVELVDATLAHHKANAEYTKRRKQVPEDLIARYSAMAPTFDTEGDAFFDATDVDNGEAGDDTTPFAAAAAAAGPMQPQADGESELDEVVVTLTPRFDRRSYKERMNDFMNGFAKHSTKRNLFRLLLTLAVIIGIVVSVKSIIDMMSPKSEEGYEDQSRGSKLAPKRGHPAPRVRHPRNAPVIVQAGDDPRYATEHLRSLKKRSATVVVESLEARQTLRGTWIGPFLLMVVGHGVRAWDFDPEQPIGVSLFSEHVQGPATIKALHMDENADLAFLLFERSIPQHSSMFRFFHKREQLPDLIGREMCAYNTLYRAGFVADTIVWGAAQISQASKDQEFPSYSGDKPHMIKADTLLEYHGPKTVKGDCGALLMGAVEPRTIIGMHVGLRKHADPASAVGQPASQYRATQYAALISQEYLQTIIDKFEAPDSTSGELVIVQSCIEPRREEEGGLYEVPSIATSTISAPPSKSNRIHPGPFHGIFGEPTKFPARMRRRAGEATHPMEVRLNQVYEKMDAYESDLRMVHYAKLFIYKHYQPGLLKGHVTWHEALNGIEGVGPIIMATSPGFPWNQKYKKKDLLLRDEQGQLVMAQELKDEVDEIYEHLRSGRVVRHLHQGQLKEEVLPAGKETRLFYAGNLSFLIIMRRVCMRLFWYIRQKCTSGPISVGINAHGKDWKMLSQRFRKKGGHLVSIDVKGFDRSLNLMVGREVAKMFAELVGGTDEEKVITTNAIMGIFLGMFVVNNCVFSNPGMNFSGAGGTTEINCVENITMGICTIMQMAFDAALDMDRFDEIDFATYGDDIVMYIPWDLFPVGELGPNYKEMFDLTITNADKGAGDIRSTDFEDISYLGRKFTKDGSAPLDLDVIHNILDWTKGDSVTRNQSTLNSFFLELTHHGKDVYMEHYNTVCQHHAVRDGTYLPTTYARALHLREHYVVQW